MNAFVAAALASLFLGVGVFGIWEACDRAMSRIDEYKRGVEQRTAIVRAAKEAKRARGGHRYLTPDELDALGLPCVGGCGKGQHQRTDREIREAS